MISGHDGTGGDEEASGGPFPSQAPVQFSGGVRDILRWMLSAMLPQQFI
jgi:hypothetical protein